MVVILLGPPGVGKGTQAVRLAETIGGEHVSTGDLLRAARREGTDLGNQAQGYMDAGELVPDSLILDLVRDHVAGVASEVSLLFDGFPRTTAQAVGLDAVLSEVGRKVDRVVLLDEPLPALSMGWSLEARMRTTESHPGSQTRQVVSPQSVWASMT